MEWNRSAWLKLSLTAAGVVVLYWGLNNLSTLRAAVGTVVGILSPFLIGLCIAYVLSVPMRGFEKLLFRPRKPGKKPRRLRLERCKGPICLTLSILTVLLLVAAVLLLIVPELGRTAVTIRDSLPGFAARMQELGGQLLERYPAILQTIQEIDWAALWDDILAFLKSGAGSVLGSTVGVIGSVFSGATAFFVGCVFACYVLLQRRTLARQLKQIGYARLREDRMDRFLKICALIDRTFTRFITGQCVEAVILGTMFLVTMSLFRFPYALMISVLIAFLALIPIFGAFFGCFIGALLILVNDPLKALWFLVLFLVLQQIEGNFIYPRVVGSSVGLPGIWVLVAVTIGGSAFGILGMLIMVPAGSVIYSLVRDNTANRLKQRKIPPRKCQ